MGSAAEATSVWTETSRTPRRPSPLTLVLVVFAVAIMLTVVALSAAKGLLAWDVRFAYLRRSEDVLHGDSPYPGLHDPILEDQKGYVYPPQLLLALVPFAALPKGVVAVIVAVGLLALLGLTLRLLGIRDIRCYAAAFLWVPSISGVLLGNVSIPIAFAAAVTWRYRDRVWPPAWALGLGRLREAPDVAASRVDGGDTPFAGDRVGARDRRARDARRVGNHRLRRAHRLSRPPPTPLRHPGPPQLLLRRYGCTSGSRTRWARRPLVVGGGAPRGVRAVRASRTTSRARSRARSPPRSR